jgi:hypothetical protein
MPSVSELINDLALRAGIAEDNEHLKAVLSSPDLSKIQVPAELESMMASRLLTVNEAKTNPEVKNHFVATTLKGADKNILEAAEEFGVDPEDKDALNSETNTYNRIKLLANAVKKFEAKKVGATGADKKALADEINKLNAEIVSLRDAKSAAVNEERSNWERKLYDMAMENHFSSYQYGNGIPDEVNRQTARFMLEKKLNELGGKSVYKDGQFVLVNKEHPDLPLTQNNKPVTMKELSDMVVAPFIKKSPAPGPTGAPPAPQSPPPASAARTVAFLEEQIKQFS